MMRGAMPDIQWKIEETISEGDKILVRYTMTGTVKIANSLSQKGCGFFILECSMIRIHKSS